jgi:hypothetical protein
MIRMASNRWIRAIGLGVLASALLLAVLIAMADL